MLRTDQLSVGVIALRCSYDYLIFSRSDSGGRSQRCWINPLLTTHIKFENPRIICYSINMDKELKVLGKIKASDITIDDIALACERAGVTLESLCTKGMEFLNAKKEVYDNDGEYIGEEKLYNVQLKAWFGFMELLKLVNREAVVMTGEVQHKMNANDVERLEAIAKELKGLESRLVTEKVQRGNIIEEAVISQRIK